MKLGELCSSRRLFLRLRRWAEDVRAERSCLPLAPFGDWFAFLPQTHCRLSDPEKLGQFAIPRETECRTNFAFRHFHIESLEL